MVRSKQSFVSGTAAAATRTQVDYFRHPGTTHLYARVTFGPETEGPPGAVHGGAIAAVLDEAMGAACWLQGHPVLGARIAIDYKRLTPLGFVGEVESWIERIDGRKIFLQAQLRDGDGAVYAVSEGLFVERRPAASP